MEQHTNGFFGLGIAPGLLDAIDKLGYTEPTPIQRKAIPIGIAGQDIIGIAQTGTGKTLAFAVPMIQHLAQTKGIGLVLVPTRELALQVHATLVKLASSQSMHTAVLIGGESMRPQLDALRKHPRIIVATPGRLIDHLEHRTVKLDDTKVLILDEADRMLDIGFGPQIERILVTVPRERHTMLFSATMPEDIVRIAAQHMKMPVRTEIAPAGTAAETVSQEVFVVAKEAKSALLAKLLTQYKGPILLFSRTKRGAHKIAQQLKKQGHSAAQIHADRTLGQRKEALEGFRSGKYRILVATDIAARGLDVKGIELVINYDLPDDPENYVHRIGRTGRAGVIGHAVSIATPEQGKDVRAIEGIIRTSITQSEHPDVQSEKLVRSNVWSTNRRRSMITGVKRRRR
ncbi:MAG: DEAD/DEAH box helicase [Bacteroidetes bacterium]|jgi:ATP-dependent RNA helicase RhlE|nr:DEAD/DEAH box helicase [Bacteroidota bacterium]